jgi:hypothetical protein
MDAIAQYGKDIAAIAFNSRNFSGIATLWNNATVGDAGRREANGQLFAAVVVWFARFIEGARAAGVRFNPEPATVNELAYLAATTRVDYLNAAARILYATKELVRVVPEIKVMQAAAVKPEPREPIEVRIVSMPSRESKTFVERDPESLEILGTTHIEADC